MYIVTRYERVTDLKDKQPDLKVLLSVGGLTLSTKIVSTMLSSWETRDWFIVNAITYLRWLNFDGLDLALQRLSTIDKRKFALLSKVSVSGCVRACVLLHVCFYVRTYCSIAVRT